MENPKFELSIAVYGMLCTSVDSPYANRCAKALRDGGFPALALARKGFHPSAYSDSYTFARDYLIDAYLSKFEGASDEKVLHELAVSSFKETEARVATINKQLRYQTAKNGVEGIISIALRKISDILGVYENRDYKFPFGEFLQSCGWGPGATSTLSGDKASRDNKILEPRLGVTGRALRYARAYLEHDTSWLSARFGEPVGPTCLLPGEFHVHEDGRFATVPKNWKSRRSIDIQPTLNLFFQKGIGKMIRRRLRRHGIDLDDQSRNQVLASRAHKDGYATIDLAKASDTISSELVRLLLPTQWYEILDDLRTHSIKIGDESHRLAKFSAMGNGFTFELESLIFYALCYAVVRVEANDKESEIAVYGDDIIVHQRHAERLITVLHEVGFETNIDKTFISGLFYESCGKHYFGGIDVTPIYQKEIVNDLPSAIRCANRLFRWALRIGGNVTLDSTAKTAWDFSVACARTYSSRFRLRKRQGRSGVLQVPLIPYTDPSDDGLLTTDYSVFNADVNGRAMVSVLAFNSSKRRANSYALLSDYLRNGSSEMATYGMTSIRGRGVYRSKKRVIWLHVSNTWVPVWN